MVNQIQSAWADGGVLGVARIAMIADLIFIGIYGVGAALGGLYFRSIKIRMMRLLGWVVLSAAVIFLITDYVETILQLVQLVQFAGNDTLAGIASSMGPVKVISFAVTFFGLLVALALEWFWTRAA